MNSVYAAADNKEATILVGLDISAAFDNNTCMPSFILIRPTVWPQFTNVTDRQDRQDRQDRETTVR